MTANDELNSEWTQAVAAIFPKGIPDVAEWDSRDDIVQVLNAIGSRKNSNHLFFPRGGGLDLSGARTSCEDGCIELNFGTSASVLCPRSLQFIGFSGDRQACYFRLDIEPLQPTGVYDSLTQDHEELADLGEGEYVDRVAWDQGYLELDENDKEVSLPAGSRIVTRWLGPGCFVIFSKGSRYNQDAATYDGRQNKMSPEEFRMHVQQRYRS